MSIKLRIIEKRLSTLENALSFLGDSLSITFPNMGVSFDSVSAGIVESNKEIEQYKADKVRAKRNDFFERNETIGYTDLAFLLNRYVPLLAENPKCDRVVRHPSSGLGSNVIYHIDLGNLSTESIENGISGHGLMTHELKLIVRLGLGIEMFVRETVTVDMETLTYEIPYDRQVLPLGKARVVNWFYDQMQRADQEPWHLPAPKRPESGRMVVHERKIQVADELFEALQPVSERLLKMLWDSETKMYGVSVKRYDRNQRKLVLHTFVGLGEEDLPFVVLRIPLDNKAPFESKGDLSVEFAYDNPDPLETYEKFKEEADKLPLKTLALVYMCLIKLNDLETGEPTTTLEPMLDERLTVEWIQGEKRGES